MMQGFINSTELNEDLYAVQVDRENCRCNTCLQVAYFVLDSAKMHFIKGDTDSLKWAISGNINRGPEQLFEEVIKDQGFYDRYKDQPLSTNITIAIDALESLHIDWHAIFKSIWEAAIKYACESKLCH
ncbi:MAG: hypothetical protein EZS28_025131 [Streblomastix strix]|uniref:Uncharacterized protein n=1 Tax=Streblomastix strix TaxID=222440 RepID=A0A5J4VAH7_9EUKA|nr:MAG: hypothetical protein EZS28_025131 [Streblomastix strix]